MNQHRTDVDVEVAVAPAAPLVLETEAPAPNRKVAGGIVAGFAALAVGVSALGGDLLNPVASTADGDYAGETVSMMIPLAEGGGTDT